MLWKIYFWFFLVITIAGGYFTFIEPGGINNFSKVIPILVAIPDTMAIFSYAYKRTLLSTKIWKIFFWINLVSVSVALLYRIGAIISNNLINKILSEQGVAFALIALIVYFSLWLLVELPPLYAIYKLGQLNTIRITYLLQRIKKLQ